MNEGTPKEQKTVRWSIRWKLMAVITLLVFALVAVLSYTQISNQRAMLEEELSKRIALLEANLIERGKSFISNLSQQVENDLAAFNFSGAMQALTESVENNDEIKYALLVEASGMVMVHTLRPDLIRTRLTAARDKAALSQAQVTVTACTEGSEKVVENVHPLQISTSPWGVLRLIYTLDLLEQEIDTSRKQIRQEIQGMIYRSLLTSLLFLGACLLVVYFLSTKSTESEPLRFYLDMIERQCQIHGRDAGALYAEAFLHVPLFGWPNDSVRLGA